MTKIVSAVALAAMVCFTGARAEQPGPDRWADLLTACVTIAERGTLSDVEWFATNDLRDACVTRSGKSFCGLQRRVWHREDGASIVVLDPPERPEEGVVTLCSAGNTRSIPGNDELGIALRARAHEVLEQGLDFREEDQILHPDVWRGCAFDGHEFRLSSITQTDWPYFHIMVSSWDKPCAEVIG